jgi:glycine/D-amino acid oxidase-like deaminating enzyme
VWAGALRPPTTNPAFERSVDVVVVGAGIAGLLTATLLARSGAEVLVVDRYEIGGVATRNTTAKISALQGTAYSAIRARRGDDAASQYAAAQLDAVGGIRRLVDELQIRCALTEASAYTYATEHAGGEHARSEYTAALEAGLPVRWEDDTDLPFDVVGAVRLDGQLHFNPGEFCTALAAELGPHRIAELAVVRDIEEQPDGCTVSLADETEISAGNVVIATQGPIIDPALLANRCAPMQSYALAARLSGAVPAGMYLSCDQSVRSLRPALTDEGTIAVVGGEGHHMGDEGAQPARWDALQNWAEGHFGPVEVTHRWATHDLVPTDHVPFVGRLARSAQRRWVATGFAKWGMTNGYVAARIISEAIGGGPAPAWASVFDSTRLASSVNRELLPLGVTATRHLVGDRLLRRTEPRCTHQGCVLRRDDAVGTWDCPCHGSRFDPNGTVIQGPATAPLDLTT